jgi:hypothetical protein
MTSARAIVGLAGVALGLVSGTNVSAADAVASDVAPLPTARFTIDGLVGTGYGWPNGLADVNHDIQASGGSWARLGQVVVEGGVLFPRAHVFVLTGPRVQIVTGTTDIYTPSFVAHARSHAFAWFWKVGWLPREPAPRLQPYVALSTGYGDIAHVVSLPATGNCGPNHDLTCVDTVTAGPLFIGWGAGLRARLTPNLDAVLGLENQLGLQADVLLDLINGRGLEEHTFNFDFNLGVAATF